jgi:hypothetical protein
MPAAIAWPRPACAWDHDGSVRGTSLSAPASRRQRRSSRCPDAGRGLDAADVEQPQFGEIVAEVGIDAVACIGQHGGWPDADIRAARIRPSAICGLFSKVTASGTPNPGAGGAVTQILGPEARPIYLLDRGAWITDGSEFNGYSGPPGGGLLPGVTIGIPQDVKIATLGPTPSGLMLARCLQEFGALIRDVSPGSGGIQ